MNKANEVREGLIIGRQAMRDTYKAYGFDFEEINWDKYFDALAILEAREAELTKDRDYWQALAMQFHDAVHAEVDRRNAEIERRAKVEI